MTRWNTACLGDLFDITSSIRVHESDWKTSGVPFYRAREIVKLSRDGSVDNELFISEQQFQEFIKKKGAPAEGDLMVTGVGTLGICYRVRPEDRFYFKDASVLWFRKKPESEVDSRFVEYAIQTNDVRRQIDNARGATVGTYTVSKAKKTEIPLPPLEEQRRIAAILDKADELRAKRREAIAKLDTLAQSIFIDMFGDIRNNIHGYETGTVGQISQLVTDGEHQTPPRSESGVKLLSARNIRNGYIDVSDVDHVTFETYDKLRKRLNPRVGDVLISCSGTIGRVTSFDLDEPVSLVRSVAVVRPEPERLNHRYLEHLLRTPMMQIEMMRSSKSSSQSNLFQGPIRKLPVLIPPMHEQLWFVDRVSHLTASLARQKNYREMADGLFMSLQQRAFKGEL